MDRTKDPNDRWNELGDLESGLGGPYVGAGAAVEQPSRILHPVHAATLTPDERISHEVVHSLDVHPGVSARELAVTVSGGEVTLRGAVEDDGMRAAAEELTRQISGVTSVLNHLRVEHSSLNVRPRR
jgi:osmotically-inducible protein OsmY